MKPKVLESTMLISSTLSVRKDRLQYAHGHEHDYYVVTSKSHSVAIIALSKKGEILITKEYRHPIGDYIYGLPGGLVDEGENPLEAAKRELLEETGCTAESFEIIGSCYPLPSIMAQQMTVVLAKGAKNVQNSSLEASELIESMFVSKLPDTKLDGILCMAMYYLNNSLLDGIR